MNSFYKKTMWTDKRIKELKEMLNEGETYQDIAEALDVTLASLRKKIWRLQHSPDATEFGQNYRWTSQEDALLREVSTPTTPTFEIKHLFPDKNSRQINKRRIMLGISMQRVKPVVVQKKQDTNVHTNTATLKRDIKTAVGGRFTEYNGECQLDGKRMLFQNIIREVNKLLKSQDKTQIGGLALWQ